MSATPLSITARGLKSIQLWGSVVKFSHSIFALPFALSMVVVVSGFVSVSISQLAWILVCMVSARSAAMGFNRLVDRRYDAANPRTAIRELPSGKVSVGSVVCLILISSVVFLGGAWMLGTHCVMLAPLVLGWLYFYSYTKRFTRYAHIVLGVALALAPGGVWYALVGTIEMRPVWMMLGVAFWVAGFDIIYACQDVEFDRSQNLWSIPRALGVSRALKAAIFLHIGCLVSLYVFGVVMSLGVIYFIGLLFFGLLVASQHRLVSASDLSRVNAAFFTRNGLASAAFFAFVLFDSWLSKP